VFRPDIAAMEQANHLAVVWIKPGNVRSLETIAMDAGKSKIIDCGWSTMLPRDNVIYLEWRGM
jgi:hypothetical protein